MEKEKTFTLDFFKQKGKQGGQNTAKRGKEYYAEIGRKGANNRWDKVKKTETENRSFENGSEF